MYSLEIPASQINEFVENFIESNCYSKPLIHGNGDVYIIQYKNFPEDPEQYSFKFPLEIGT